MKDELKEIITYLDAINTQLGVIKMALEVSNVINASEEEHFNLIIKYQNERDRAEKNTMKDNRRKNSDRNIW